MMSKNERMEKLNNAGVDTTKYFDLELPRGLKPGAKIQLVISENGAPMVVCDNYDENTIASSDYIAKQIIADGYVRNTKLHRRFVMAQMFHMLNFESYDRKETGYHAYLNTFYGYQYTLDMMLEEVKVLSKLESRDRESFEERVHFFDKKVVVAVLEDYMEKLKDYVNCLPNKNCKGVPYKRVKGENIFNADLEKKLYAPLRKKILNVSNAKNYAFVYTALQRFMKDMIKLPYNTPKSKVWVDTFKGEGAYYTLKNLVMFHDCVIYTGKYGIMHYNKAMNLTGVEAVNYINNKLDEYKGEGWRMFALMKKVIADNNFDFNARMKEIYTEK